MRKELTEGFKIGKLVLTNKLILAPLAGISNLPFRLMCRKQGAALVMSEMVSCHALVRGQPKTLKMLKTDLAEKPVGFQIFGSEPEIMAKAAYKLEEIGAVLVDLNFGCPVPKVVRHGSGSALLKEPERLENIVQSCVKRVNIPITVKIRIGWDDTQINAVEIAQRVEQAGAQAITVHARTRSQGFAGQARWEIISAVVKKVNIPVIGNGDVKDGNSAKKMLINTGCSGIMIGRAALGRPWIFNEIKHYLEYSQELPEPSIKKKLEFIREHYKGLKKLKGEQIANREIRKHTAWYIKGLPKATEVRQEINRCEREKDFFNILKQAEKQWSNIV